MGRNQLSPDVYAELLSIQSDQLLLQETRNLVKAHFRNEEILLQPIVWGNLLRNLLPFPPEDDLIQWSFYAIPLSYWCIGYTTPLFLMPNGLQICSIPDTDHQAVSLWAAVNTHLYPYVADVILRSHADATDSVYH